MLIKEISPNDYIEFTDQVDQYPFLNKIEFCHVLQSVGYKTLLLGMYDEDELVAVTWAFEQKIFLGKILKLITGVLVSDSQVRSLFYKALIDYSHKHHYSVLSVMVDGDQRIYNYEGELIKELDSELLQLMPEFGYDHELSKESRLDGMPTFQYLKDLSDFMPDDAKGLLKSFNNNSQRNIKKAKKLGIQVKELTYDDLDTFKEITQETADRQGFSDKSLTYFQSFYKLFKDQVEFLQAEIHLPSAIKGLEERIQALNPDKKNDQQQIASLETDVEILQELYQEQGQESLALANMLMVYLPHEATYFIGGSVTEFQKLPAPFLLQYEAMLRTLKRRINKYNFYGINGDFDGSDGVLRFKQNFNGYIVEKIGNFVYYPQPRRYRLIKSIKDLANRLLGRS